MLRGPVQWKRALPVAIIAALCAVPLAEALVGKDALYARDVSILFWSTRTFAARSFDQGRLPGWDPRSQCGMPFLGNAPTGVLYPPTALFSVLPFPRAYAWFVYLHQVFGACGVFVLLRRLQLGRSASLAGALTFGLGGCVASMVNAGPFMAGAAFVPWIVAALVSDGPGLRRAALAALGIAAQVLAGDPQAVIYAVLAALILAACRVRREAILRPLALALPLAAALAAIQLLPAWGVLQESDRAEFASGFMTAFALHPARLLELALPLPFGTPAGTPEFWGGALVHGPGRWPFALSAYVGAAALAFAVLGVGRDRVAVGGAAIFCCGLLLASGSYTPLGGWILPLPPFRFFRYPEKYLVLAALGIAILMACGVDRLGAGLLTRRRLAIASAAGLIALAALEVAFRSDAILAGFLGWVHASRVTPATARETLQTALAQAALGGGLALGLGWVSTFRPRLQFTLAGLAPLVVAVDLLGPARAVALTGPSEIYSEPPLVDTLRRSAPAGPWRFLREEGIERGWRRLRRLDGREGNFLERAHDVATLRGDIGGVFGLEEVRGYGSSFSLTRWRALALALYPMPERLSALWNGCLLLGPARGGEFEGRPGLATLFTDENLNLRLYRHERCLPRIRSVPETRTVSTLQEAVETVAQPDFQVEEVALVEHGPNRRWGSAELSDVVSDEQALTSRITAGPGGAFVVAAIPWSRGWQASVDGIQTSISIVDGALMGFQVPEGAHRLELRYRIPGLLPGALLSLLGTIVAIALLLRRARPSSLPEADRSTESSRPTV